MGFRWGCHHCYRQDEANACTKQGREECPHYLALQIECSKCGNGTKKPRIGFMQTGVVSRWEGGRMRDTPIGKHLAFCGDCAPKDAPIYSVREALDKHLRRYDGK